MTDPPPQQASCERATKDPYCCVSRDPAKENKGLAIHQQALGNHVVLRFTQYRAIKAREKGDYCPDLRLVSNPATF